MPTIFEGTFATPPRSFRDRGGTFNQSVVEKLLAGAIDGLKRHGVPDNCIDIAWVPGSFEIPLVAHRLAGSTGTVPSSVWVPSLRARPITTTMSPAPPRLE